MMVVLACVRIVIVRQLRQVKYPLVTHLQNGYTDSHIIGSLQIVPLIIFEICFIDVHEELSVEGSQMAGHEGIGTVLIIRDG